MIHPKTLKPGDRVSEYVLEALVGRGGFGDVWRARHRVWHDRVVAIKIPRDPDLVRLLRSEGAIQHALDGPGIVRAIGLDADHDPPYLVMEFVEGESLRARLERERRLEPPAARRIGRAILEVLASAHERGFVHRDLKPENVLLERGTGAVKLTDFGLGKAVEGAAARLVLSGELGTEATEGGVAEAISGTLAYMAPEQKEPGRAIDARADVYAFGILLFEMLTGARPEGGEVPSDLVAGLGPRVDDLFKRCYCRYEKRFEDAGAALAALSELERAAGGGRDVDAPPPVARLQRRSDGWTTTFPLRSPLTRIGAAPGCEIRLLDPGVAPEHAAIFHHQGAWWIRDLGSASKTMLRVEVPVGEAGGGGAGSGVRVVHERVGRAPLKLGEGVTVLVGDVELVFRDGSPAPRLEARRLPRERPAPSGPSSLAQATAILGAATLGLLTATGRLPDSPAALLAAVVALLGLLKVFVPRRPQPMPAAGAGGAGGGAGGAGAGRDPRFAGFLLRTAALGLDLMLLAAVLDRPWSPLAYFAYDALATWIFGATAGKWLLGLVVVSEDGRPVTLKQSIGRSLSKVLSALPWGIGFLLAAMNARKQALHDFVAETAVMRRVPRDD